MFKVFLSSSFGHGNTILLSGVNDVIIVVRENISRCGKSGGTSGHLVARRYFGHRSILGLIIDCVAKIKEEC